MIPLLLLLPLTTMSWVDSFDDTRAIAVWPPILLAGHTFQEEFRERCFCIGANQEQQLVRKAALIGNCPQGTIGRKRIELETGGTFCAIASNVPLLIQRQTVT